MNGSPGHHAHDVGLDDTFDFLNTDELQEWFPRRAPARPSVALDWFVDRGVIHMEGADRIRATRVAPGHRRARPRQDPDRPPSAPRGRGRHRRAASARQRRAGDRQSSAPRPAGHRARGGARRRAASTTATSAIRSTTPSPASPIRWSANWPTATRSGSGSARTTPAEWVFYDTSRTSRRRWCDMATCGNRAKAARHRATREGPPMPSRRLADGALRRRRMPRSTWAPEARPVTRPRAPGRGPTGSPGPHPAARPTRPG